MVMHKFLAGVVAATLSAGLVSCGGNGNGAAVTYTVGGNLSGSVPVVLQLNGGNDLTLSTAGPFVFTAGVLPGAAYSVTAVAPQNCTVSNGAGAMGGSNVANVAVVCTTVVRSATLNAAQENPPTTSTATGRGAVIVDPVTREITGGIVFTGLTPTAGGHHIHQAPAGNPTQNGPVIVGLTLSPDGNVATVPAGTVLTPTQYAALVAGELYFNVHTAANPSGEIRGQINTRGGVVAGLASLSGTQESPANASTAVGRGTVVVDATTRDVLIAYDTHNVVNSTLSHIHSAAAGVNGPVILSLTQGTGIFSAPNPSTLTAQNLTDLLAGNTYFNVHSTAFGGGEIRGQIAIQ